MATRIMFKDMMNEIHSGAAFSMTFVTLNDRKGTGGEKVHVPKAMKSYNKNDKMTLANGQQLAPLKKEKKPHHDYNGTINIKTSANNFIKVHTYLIIEFNNQEVAI